jgi:copper oxidase (laccase) domain-containing protein
MRAIGATQISGLLGPAICGSCYEVPLDLHNRVTAVHPLASSKTRFGAPALDLPKALIAALTLVDVPVGISAGCTLEDEDLFSYRRNQRTGRQAGVIKL